MPRNRKAAGPYFTIEETASTLKVSERTVRRWIARGVLPGRKIARTVRVPAVAVTAEAVRKRRPARGRPRRGAARSEVLDLAAIAMMGGAFDWLYDPREDGYSFDDGEPL